MPCRNNVVGCKFLGVDSTHHAATCPFYACLWRSNGCNFIGTKSAIGMHERACDYAVVYCLLREKGCQFTCQRRDLPKHFELCVRQKESQNFNGLVDMKKNSRKDDKKAIHIDNFDTSKVNKLQERAQQIIDDKPVILNVGGHEITTSLRLLCRYPASVLGLLGARARKSDQRPRRLFLDRDIEVIENVLTFLRYGRLPPHLTVREHTLLLWEAEYLALPELARVLKAQPPNETLVVPTLLELDMQGFGAIARSLL